MTSNKLDPSLVAILVNREHSRLSNQIKALEKVLRAPYSDGPIKGVRVIKFC